VARRITPVIRQNMRGAGVHKTGGGSTPPKLVGAAGTSGQAGMRSVPGTGLARAKNPPAPKAAFALGTAPGAKIQGYGPTDRAASGRMKPSGMGPK
jgi:hypothetical protein